MKLGIVGSGMIVKEFLPSLVKLEDLEILGIQGTKSGIKKVEEICKKYNIPNFTDNFDELCNFGIEKSIGKRNQRYCRKTNYNKLS